MEQAQQCATCKGDIEPDYLNCRDCATTLAREWAKAHPYTAKKPTKGKRKGEHA